MNKTIMRKWVKALRSGKYKQGRNKLYQETKTGPRYCCLGVLCEIYEADRRKKKKKIVEWRHTDLIPTAIRDWADMDSTNGTIYDGKLAPLAVLNDDGKRFTTIANLIEKECENL